MLVVFRGLPGTGKSHLVSALVGKRPGLLVLSRDSLRASIVPSPTFQADEKDLVDDLIVSMAGFLLRRGRDVVIDGMALSSASRVEEFVHAARSQGAELRIVQCECSEKTALARIARDGGAHPAGDRGESLYHETRKRFQPIAHPHLTLDTDRDTADILGQLLDYLPAPSRDPML
jgi:predicted kinase